MSKKKAIIIALIIYLAFTIFVNVSSCGHRPRLSGKFVPEDVNPADRMAR